VPRGQPCVVCARVFMAFAFFVILSWLLRTCSTRVFQDFLNMLVLEDIVSLDFQSFSLFVFYSLGIFYI
jgi:hypothetical protein